MKYCTSCGERLRDEAVFCTACGKKCIERKNSQSTTFSTFSLATDRIIDIESTKKQNAIPSISTAAEEPEIPEKTQLEVELDNEKLEEKKYLAKGRIAWTIALILILVVAIMIGVPICQDVYEEQVKEHTMQTAIVYAEAGDYTKAREVINEVVKTYGYDETLVSAYFEYGNQYTLQIIDQVDKMIADGEYDLAIACLSDHMVCLPESDMLSEKLEQIIRDRDLTSAVCFNGHYYKVYDGLNTWEDAEIFCNSSGGHLATISSKEENDFLREYVAFLGLDGAYFGFSDAETEGDWQWVSGEKITFIDWAAGEPGNEGNREHYGLFDFVHTDGRWNDGDYMSGVDTSFICEWDEIGGEK